MSVTTDGFICDIEDVENKILKLEERHTPLFRKYRVLREELSGNPTAIELKTEVKGILS